MRSAPTSGATSRVARVAAEAYLGALDPIAVASAAADVRVPGRLQVVGERPLTLLDGAHNPDGIAALAESLPEIARPGRRVVAVVSILDDKDAADDAAALAAASATRSSDGARTRARCLRRRCNRSSGSSRGANTRDGRAIRRRTRRARELAGPDGVVVATARSI